MALTLDLTGTDVKAKVNTGTVTAGRFVKPVITNGDVQVAQATLGARVFGVAKDDGDVNQASKSTITVVRSAHRLAQVTAGGTVTADDLVMSDANGKAITHDGNEAHAVAGRALIGGAANATILIEAATTFTAPAAP